MKQSIWFPFGSAQFLIKPFNFHEILSVRDRLKNGKMTEEEGLKKLFKASLAGFKGIPGCENLSKSKKVDILFGDLEIRNFVLRKAYLLLFCEVAEIEKLADVFEKFLFITGKLKS